MILSKVSLNPKHDSYHENLANLSQSIYHEHTLIWQLFSKDPDKTRPFIYRNVSRVGATAEFLVLSSEAITEHPIFLSQSKTFQPHLKKGQLLQFELRANPVVVKADQKDKKKNHDVIYNAIKSAKDKKEGFSKSKIIQEKGLEWLSGRAPNKGFSIETDSTMVMSYNPIKTGKKNRTSIRLSMVDYKGILTVEDPDLFIDSIGKGIGKARAFGCGLILIKPI